MNEEQIQGMIDAKLASPEFKKTVEALVKSAIAKVLSESFLQQQKPIPTSNS